MQPDRLARKPVFVAVVLAMATGMLGGLATNIGPWYFDLVKPSWQPPDWLFGPVWTTIYILTGIAGVRAWRCGDAVQRQRFLIALLLNIALNILWSVLFFTMQRPDWALVEVVLLWLSVMLLIVLVRGYAPLSAVLLVPYLLWVGFAAYLNWTIVTLNAPF
jgi:tryptophan-rich sensory protein